MWIMPQPKGYGHKTKTICPVDEEIYEKIH
jgi:hypothetical protein